MKNFCLKSACILLSAWFIVNVAYAGADREQAVFKATLAQQMERWDEAFGFMRYLAQLNVEMTAEERVLFSTAYENLVQPRLADRAFLLAVEQDWQHAPVYWKMVIEYREAIEEELHQLNFAMISDCDNNLIPSSGTIESRVFWYTVKGNAFRYVAEYSIGEMREHAADAAIDAYYAAGYHAENLAADDPVRLDLALKYASFYAEIENDLASACSIVSEAYYDAVSSMDDDDWEDDEDEGASDNPVYQLLAELREKMHLWCDLDD